MMEQRSSPDGLTVYVDPGIALQPATPYTVRAAARSHEGAELPVKGGTWSFTTEAAADSYLGNGYFPTWGGRGGVRTREDRILIDHVYLSGVPLE